MNIEEIVNEHTREIIKNIFNKLDDEEIYVILELNNQLQDKINKIGKAIEILKDTSVDMPSTLLIETIDYARHILGDKEQEEYTLTPDENGTTQINGEWYKVEKIK